MGKYSHAFSFLSLQIFNYFRASFVGVSVRFVPIGLSLSKSGGVTSPISALASQVMHEEMLAVISLNGLVGFVVFILVLGAICWLLTWIIDYVTPPPPIAKVGKSVIMVAGVLLLIYALLGFVGIGGVTPVIRF